MKADTKFGYSGRSYKAQKVLTLDLASLSEFPSLSSGPQNTTPTPGQAIWGNAGQRSIQQSLGQRQPQAPVPPQAPSRESQLQAQQAQSQGQAQGHEDQFPSTTQFVTQLDDFRNGVQAMGQMSGGSQQQAGSVDDFPPLSKQSDQAGAVGNYASSMGFTGFSAQTRSSLGNQQDTSRIASPAAAGPSGTPGPRLPAGQNQNGIIGQDHEDNAQTQAQAQAQAQASMMNQRSMDQMQQQQQPPQPQPSQVQAQAQAENEAHDPSRAGQTAEQASLSQMSEHDRFGLAGLLRMIHSDSPDVASLAIGQDLMSLGLDLNQQEPLHQTFASPFISSNVSVPLRPDFTLPACYNVANVQPLQTRIPSFSDETLFYIFYSMPRDIMQELVAEELMGRKWRYHKVERAWLTRDDTYPNPVEVERGISERGVYLWWDTSSWKKVRREFILRYADLDNRLDPGRNIVRGIPFPQAT
ncbi:transcription subunit 2 general negative regulator [Nannizzia gypsea CBS 118893]|uniref:Transcription subunit 2 general negative regulator n=1 Tax=Arthroderma gypseum (strain ATCC MYA-4604 / CBS 118893) TaxID=535722 RepID=E4UQE7_ARTGP|nr:transcription subunit 2 general negative regulator [Nannizzia gypsea CBS 118893]EFR00017.1 transcription subunit 2 general negative regulator [Nannizzia gypsea CBS 118893]